MWKTLWIPLSINFKRQPLLPFQIWYFVYFGALGLIVPRMSPFVYQDLGVPQPGLLFLWSQIAMPIGALLSGYLSDLTLKTRRIIMAKLVVAIVSLSGLTIYLPSGQVSATILFSLLMAAMGGILPLVNISYLQTRSNHSQYGHARVFGTLGFMLPNLFLAFMDVARPVLLSWATAFFVASLLLLAVLPSERKIEKKPDEVHPEQIGKLLSSPLFILFMFVILLYNFSFSPAEFIISNYVTQIPESILPGSMEPVAFSWFLGTFTEVLFFVASPWFVKRMGPMGLMMLSLVAGAARYGLLLAFPAGFSAILVQSLHGLQFGPMYLASVLHVQQKAHPQRLGTAQAMVMVVGKAAGNGMGAWLFGIMAMTQMYAAIFEISLALSVFAMVVLAFYIRRESMQRYFVKV